MPSDRTARPRSLLVLPLFASLVVSGPAARSEDWPQWGGPRRDFTVEGDLAETWPADGPALSWSRPLGDAYAGIVTHQGRLFTSYRADGQEHTVALDAADGHTLWDQHAPAPYLEGTNVEENGPGPHATPAIIGDRLVTVGVTGTVHCLDLADGAVVWRHALAEEFGGTRLFRGYSACPIACDQTVIVPVGGVGQAVVAFRVSDGSVAWSRHGFDISHVAPLLIDLDGQRQLVVVGSKVIVGLDPATGDLLWRHEHAMSGDHVAMMPLWDPRGYLFFSGAYGEGSHGLRIERRDGQTTATELWHAPRMRVHHSNVVQSGDLVLGPSGDFAALVFTALDIRTGEVAWQDRRVPRVNTLRVGSRLLLLEEGGRLMLATPGSTGLTIDAEHQLFEGRARTPPTLAGTGCMFAIARISWPIGCRRPAPGQSKALTPTRRTSEALSRPHAPTRRASE